MSFVFRVVTQLSRLMLMARRVRRRRPLLTPSLHSSQPTRAGGMLRFLFIAVVACDGAYMGVTTNVPQQLALGTPLSCRAAPAVAVMSKKRPKQYAKQTPWYEKEVYKSPEQRQKCAAAPVPAHTWSNPPIPIQHCQPRFTECAQAAPHLLLSRTARLCMRGGGNGISKTGNALSSWCRSS